MKKILMAILIAGLCSTQAQAGFGSRSSSSFRPSSSIRINSFSRKPITQTAPKIGTTGFKENPTMNHQESIKPKIITKTIEKTVVNNTVNNSTPTLLNMIILYELLKPRHEEIHASSELIESKPPEWTEQCFDSGTSDKWL